MLSRFLTHVPPARCTSPAWPWGSGLPIGYGPRRSPLWPRPNCCRYCGADVDFIDIEPSTGLMSVAVLVAKLEQAERDGIFPKVVVPVHLTGSSCDMAAIAALADRYGFAVLEDASHAIGGRYQGRLWKTSTIRGTMVL